MKGNTVMHVCTHARTHTHTQACVGVISMTQGTGIVYFLFSQSEEIRGQHTTEKPDSTHPKRGGSQGRGVCVNVTANEGLYRNLVVVQASLATSAKNNVSLTKRIRGERKKKTLFHPSL